MEPKDLHVEVIGKGFPLVLLHGWGQSSQSLKPLAQLLSHQSKLILVDLPGFGHSSLPTQTWSSQDYAHYIAKFLKEQGIEKFDLLGHSFGGKISISLASLYPNRVRQLILVASSGLKRRLSIYESIRSKLLKYMAISVKNVDRVAKTQLFQNYFIPRFGSKDYQQAGSMRAILVKSVNEDVTPQIKCIVSPTLILWGSDDQEAPVEFAERMNKLIPQSTLHVFPGKGHQLFADCGAHLCASYILPFLKADAMEF